MKKKNGFTMIELLVVISVIVLLTALVIIAVTQVRVKANNSRIKGDMDQLRKQAEVIYAENGMNTYCAVANCFSGGIDTRVSSLTNDIKLRSYQGAPPFLSANATGYCISATLAENKKLCYDSSGKQTLSDTSGITGTCNGNPAVCQ